jgi:hypothetical protein
MKSRSLSKTGGLSRHGRGSSSLTSAKKLPDFGCVAVAAGSDSTEQELVAVDLLSLEGAVLLFFVLTVASLELVLPEFVAGHFAALSKKLP